MCRIHIYAKRYIINEALKFLLESYGYECQPYNDVAALLKEIEDKPSAIVVLNESLNLMKHDWSSIKNPIILLKNSGHELPIEINAPNLTVLNNNNVSEKLSEILADLKNKINRNLSLTNIN